MLAEEGRKPCRRRVLINEEKQCCDFWMAHLFGEVFNAATLGPTSFPRLAMAQFLHDYKDGWAQTTEYRCDDPRLPEVVRDFNSAQNLFSTLVAPLILGGKNLGWITLCVADEPESGSWWRIAMVEAIARHAALALHKSRCSNRNAPRSAARRFSRNATGSRATFTTTWRRGSGPF
jgi:hypothetical protein